LIQHAQLRIAWLTVFSHEACEHLEVSEGELGRHRLIRSFVGGGGRMVGTARGP
jgi:hypothetical protein